MYCLVVIYGTRFVGCGALSCTGVLVLHAHAKTRQEIISSNDLGHVLIAPLTSSVSKKHATSACQTSVGPMFLRVRELGLDGRDSDDCRSRRGWQQRTYFPSFTSSKLF